jgi:hypothetical protein
VPAAPDAPEVPPPEATPDDDAVPVDPPAPSGPVAAPELDAPVPQACVPQTSPQRLSATPTATAPEKLATPRTLGTFSMLLPSSLLYHVAPATRQASADVKGERRTLQTRGIRRRDVPRIEGSSAVTP